MLGKNREGEAEVATIPGHVAVRHQRRDQKGGHHHVQALLCHHRLYRQLIPMVIMTRTSLGDEGMEAKRSLQLIHAFPKIDPVQNRKDLTPGPSREKSDHAQDQDRHLQNG